MKMLLTLIFSLLLWYRNYGTNTRSFRHLTHLNLMNKLNLDKPKNIISFV
jgi:hypothetical protein